MNRTEKLSELRSLQVRCDAIRQELEINPPGKITFWAPLNVSMCKTVVVEADGFGGATASVVEGNYPVDYVTNYEESFPSESEAETAAEALAFDTAAPQLVLGVGA